ncbi:peptide chain release factor 2 [Clostridiaceae bacterium]|nr:peptide chain release factor 2 [Clostridium sp.]NBI72221.1 peptide chain release factor 2 [Clostridiaceae bacterium]
MVEFDQFKYTLSTYDTTLVEVGIHFDLDNKVKRIDELDKSMEEPGFWDDPERSTKIMKEAKNLKDTVETYRHLEQQYEDIQVMLEMGYEENDASLIPEIQEMLDGFVSSLEAIRTRTLLSGEYDNCNAILKLNAGAGGTEAMDWCSMLWRMYQRWADKKGYSTEVLDFLDGDEAGLKSITVQINGENAFGYLKSEKGVHRLVRISPFNAAGKRQTSFVSCDVMPDIEEDLDVEINPDELRIDTYRSSGAGGQHINKTSSAIRITHLPTGIVVQCQNERSQFQNKDKAMQMLKAKLYLLKQQENAEKLSDIRGDVKDINFGNQIRSYVMQPYTLVKDHRTSAENGNVNAVMDGDLDLFISAYLKWISLKEQAPKEA